MDITINDELISGDEIFAAASAFIDAPDPLAAAGRALAVQALLRQRCRALCIAADTEDAAIDALLEREVKVPEQTEEECRRYHAANSEKLRSGDLFEASHILFAVVEGAPVEAIRRKAEEVLLDLRIHPEKFADAAREYSNCPSAQLGGNLGQLDARGCVPEFFRALRESRATGVLPRLVQTRYGFHIVQVARRIPGREVPLEEAQAWIASTLSTAVRQKAFDQYVSLLAAQADITGVDLSPAASPLVQ